MSAVIEVGGPLTVEQRASRALTKAETEAEIKALVEQSKCIVAVTDAAGREACHKSMMTLAKLRIQTQKRAKEGRDEAVKYSKAVIEIEKELVALIEPEETRLERLRDEWDAVKEREKQAKIDAEIKRVTNIQARVAELRGCQTLTPSSGSALIAEHIADLEKIPVDDSFEEFRQQAEDAKLAALSRLTALHTAALAHEAEQETIRLERAELARLRAEQAERDRIAREAQAEADAKAQAERERLEAVARAERDAEAARQAEANRIERERIAQEEAAAKAVRDAEARRLADERAENERIARERQAELDRKAEEQRMANEAEQRRLADRQAEIDRQQAALRAAQAPKPKSRKAPAGQELVEVVAKHYGVEPKIALGWLLKIDWKAEKAA